MGRRLFFLPFGAVLAIFPVVAQCQQVAPSIVWQKSLGGSRDDQANTIVRTPGGGFLVAGFSLSNDGDVSGHHGSIDSMDAWVVKLSSTGSIQWQKSIGGSGNDVLTQMIPTSDGNYVGIGYTTSNDGDVTGNHGLQDVMVVKLDRNGNILWLKSFGGSRNESGVSIRQTADGGYIFAANTTSSDGNVSGNPLIGGYPAYAAWVVKLDASGNFIWQGCYGQVYTPTAHDILPLSDGTYVLGLETQSDNGSNQGLFSTGGNPPLPFLAKIGATGQLLETQNPAVQRARVYGFVPINSLQYYFALNLSYCYPINPDNGLEFLRNDTTVNNNNTLSMLDEFGECPNSSSPSVYGYGLKGPGSMVVTGAGSGIAAGFTSDTVAISQGNHLSIHLGNHGGIRDGLLVTFSPNTWGKCYGGSADDAFQGLVSVGDSVYIAAGFTNSTNGDVTGNHGGYDFWVVDMSKTNNIRGTVYMDYNANGIQDAGEPLVDNILVQSAKGAALSGSSTFNGLYNNSVDTGTYVTSVISSLPYYAATPASHTSVFATYNNTDMISFGLQPIPGKRDYLISLYPLGPPRPGFGGVCQVECVNAGTDTLTNRTAQLILDHRIQYQSASPSPASVSGDTLRWTIASLSPRDTALIMINIKFAAPPLLNNGDFVSSTASIDTTGDLNPVNNSYTLYQLMEGSYDPNGKEEANGGVVYTNDLGKGKYLLYTIHFQNTGTDTAFTVVVTDTLSAKLDPTTVEMTGASGPYTLTTTNGNILTWTFSNIRLPDSTANATGSKGWLSFRVKPVAGVVAGDSIVNTADIYFDFNLPVATKSVVTDVRTNVGTPPVAPVISGLQADYCQNLGAQQVTVSNMPALGSGITVSGNLDGQAVTVSAAGGITIQPQALTVGAHTLSVIFTNSAGADTTKAAFQVEKAVTPVVKLAANPAILTAATTHIELEASDVSGGGSQPLYTFARDAGFTSIIQAKGPVDSASVAVSGLVTGNNVFYVRMQTSDSCVTAATATDSVVVVKTVDTVPQPPSGLTIGPNPFKGTITIDGVQANRSYGINLFNSMGQEVIGKVVQGQTQVVLQTGTLQRGIYFLKIYDLSSGKVVAIVRLLSATR